MRCCRSLLASLWLQSSLPCCLHTDTDSQLVVMRMGSFTDTSPLAFGECCGEAGEDTGQLGLLSLPPAPVQVGQLPTAVKSSAWTPRQQLRSITETKVMAHPPLPGMGYSRFCSAFQKESDFIFHLKSLLIAELALQ